MTHESREAPQKVEPMLITSISDRAAVGNLVNIGHARDIYDGSPSAPQALFQLPPDIPDFVGRAELPAVG